jgi:hypothetical protein
MSNRSEQDIIAIRERFVRHFLFKPTDRPPHWETIQFWDYSIRRWEQEGFPKGRTGEDYFDLEALYWIPEIPIIWIPFYPAFEETRIEDLSDNRIIRNEYGITIKEYKKGESISQNSFMIL